jgi:hypothetical protein
MCISLLRLRRAAPGLKNLNKERTIHRRAREERKEKELWICNYTIPLFLLLSCLSCFPILQHSKPQCFHSSDPPPPFFHDL